MKKYGINISKIELGDIVLSTTKKSFVSTVIRMATKSNYSHAALILGQTMLMEARENGVFALNTLRSVFNSPSEFLILKCPALTTSQKNKIDEFSRGIAYGSPYNFKGIFTDLIRNNPKIDLKEFYCSQFVYESYKYAGINLVKKPFLGKYVTPKNLLESELLKQIDNYFVELESNPNLDGNIIISHQQKILRKFVNITTERMRLFGIKISNLSDIFDIYKHIESGKIDPSEINNVDRCLVSALEESRYCYGVEDVFIPNSLVARGVEALTESQPPAKVLDLLADVFRSELKRFEGEYPKFVALNQKYNLEFYAEIAKLYEKLINFNKIFLNTVLDTKRQIQE